MPSVVVFELNEVPWSVVDWWVERHPDSALAGLLAVSDQRTSVAADEGHLSPWVTWPTVHRGVPNTVHGIGHFGQDTSYADQVAPPWWVAATNAGRRVGLFGLLHTATLPDDLDPYAFFVPDTFAPTANTHPGELGSFQAFNLSMARASARNVSTAVDLPAARRFLARAPRLGLRPATVARLVAQLVGERRRPETRVRRRSFQSVIAFDLFMQQLRSTRPDAAAFFTNHVASAMHRYWAATWPDDYPAETFGFDNEWIGRWSGELEAAFAHADRMLGRLRDHCEQTGTVLVVASSMGQQAAQGTPVGRQLYLRDLLVFLADAGIAATAVEQRPAMDPQVNLQVDKSVRAALRTRLTALRIGDQEIDWEEGDGGFFSLTFGQADDAIGDVVVDGIVRNPEDLGLEIIEIEDEVASTGYHVPEGVLLTFDPRHAQGNPEREPISTTEIAPLVLSLLDVDLADRQRAPVGS